MNEREQCADQARYWKQYMSYKLCRTLPHIEHQRYHHGPFNLSISCGRRSSNFFSRLGSAPKRFASTTARSASRPLRSASEKMSPLMVSTSTAKRRAGSKEETSPLALPRDFLREAPAQPVPSVPISWCETPSPICDPRLLCDLSPN